MRLDSICSSAEPAGPTVSSARVGSWYTLSGDIDTVQELWVVYYNGPRLGYDTMEVTRESTFSLVNLYHALRQDVCTVQHRD